MNLGELISRARVHLRDKLIPYMWSDEELIDFTNEAIDEACLRARLLSGSYAVSVLPGIQSYTLPVTALQVVTAFFIASSGVSVNAGSFTIGEWYIINTVGDTDFTLIGASASTVGIAFRATGAGAGTGTAYQSNVTIMPTIGRPEFFAAEHVETTASTPAYLAIGDSPNEIVISPPPSTSGVLILEVRRMPSAAEQLVDLSDVPVIHEEFHKDLIYWVLAQAYDVDDIDKAATRKYDKNMVMFEARFGRRITARGERMGRYYGVGKDVYPRSLGD